MFIPFLAAPIGWFNGTKGLRSITVQRKKHSLTGAGKAVCNHNSSYLLIFYLKHSDANRTVPCQQPRGKGHFETKTNFLRAGKSDGRHSDKLLWDTDLFPHTRRIRELSLICTGSHLTLTLPLQSGGRHDCFTVIKWRCRMTEKSSSVTELSKRVTLHAQTTWKAAL